MKVVMLGADRSVKGGVSAVVNNLYEAGLDQRIDLTYIGTMVDGSTVAKLLKGVQALLKFVTVLPKAEVSCRRPGGREPRNDAHPHGSLHGLPLFPLARGAGRCPARRRGRRGRAG